VTSKKQGNGIIESKVALYSIKAIHTYLSDKCQSWPRFRVRNSTFVEDTVYRIGLYIIYVGRDLFFLRKELSLEVGSYN
jgi:hypothetical protein